MPKTAKIYGPPGTGKTTYQTRQILLDLQRNCLPDDIGMVSHTNAAVDEAAQRVMTALNLKKKPKNFNTIHSFCFQLLELKKDQVAESAKNLKMFNEAYPEFALSGGKTEEDDDSAYQDSTALSPDETFKRINILRNKEIKQSQWPADYMPFWEAWSDFLFQNNLTDFTGMLESAKNIDNYPDIKHLYVDEYQDATPLACSVLEKWASHCQKAVYTGDDDQAIFRFTGADGKNLMKMKADFSHVLPQSWRVAPEIMRYAQRIIRQIHDRENITCKPCEMNGKGAVLSCNIPELEHDGTHMILARTHKSLARWISFLKDNHIPFKNDYRPEEWRWNPTKTKAWQAAKTWMELKKGHPVSMSDIKTLGSMMIADMAFEKGMKTRLSEIPDDRNMYYLFDLLQFRIFSTKLFLAKENDYKDFIRFPKGQGSAFAQQIMSLYPEKIMEEPKVTVGTIHSVKGGEADHVWIDSNMSVTMKRKIYQADDDFERDAEICTAYVAVTRAKKTAGILSPSNRKTKNPYYPEI